MKPIEYRDLSAGPVEVCRQLCDQLMAHQASMGRYHVEALAAMNFDTRLKPSFEGAGEKLLLVAYDGDTPVGYVFAAAEVLPDVIPPTISLWGMEGPGFFPDWIAPGTKIGSLNNLFVLPQYRGMNIGKELTDRAMAWLRAVPGAQYLFVDVSNGNNAGPFYEKYGFRFSHDVLGGFIQAYCQKV